LTEEMRQAVNGARASGNPCIVATASPDGTPNAGFIGTVLAYDEAGKTIGPYNRHAEGKRIA
jgi:hypothetical protein